MRGDVFLAAGLLVTNLVIIHESKQPAPAATPVIEPTIEPTIVEAQPSNITGLSTEGQRLRWFWQAKHNALRVPRCDHFDPLATLDADVDATPGREHLVGNRRFGVMMFDEQGTFLAHMDPIGCGEAREGDQSLSLAFDERLIVHARNLRADGEHLDATIVERRDDELITLLALDVGGRRTLGREYDVEGRIVTCGEEVEVIYHGRQREPGGTWEAVDDHCTWQLATRTSSCRTRAGARTREWE